MKRMLAYLLAMILITALIQPVIAGEKLVTDGPDIVITIDGTNVIAPGQETTLTLAVQNKGLIDMKLVQTQYMTTDYLPNTAKGGFVTLQSGNSPVVVKSGTQTFGDLPAGYMKDVSYTIYIPQTARSGTYQMTAVVEYEYMYGSEQYGSDAITYDFKKVKTEIPVTIIISPSVVLEVTNVTSENLNAGGEGYISMDITNIGTDDAKTFAAFINPAGNSPISPVDNGVFVGDLPKGKKVTVGYKVAVSSTADERQSYPVLVYGTYKDYEGLDAQTAPVTIGISFDGKIKFNVVSDKPTVGSGENVIAVVYKNTGQATAYQAQGRISVVSPFSSSDTNSYIGDIAPGEEKTAYYKIKVASDATPKDYSLDSEIRYTDSENNNYVSDTVKVIVSYQESAPTGTIIIIVLVIVIAGAGYYLYSRKKNN